MLSRKALCGLTLLLVAAHGASANPWTNWLFPAGVPRAPDMQGGLAVKPLYTPPIPENGYRGAYVSRRPPLLLPLQSCCL
jgi:hypothetical protein